MVRTILVASLVALMAGSGVQAAGGTQFAVESVAVDGSGALTLAAGQWPYESPTFSRDGRTVAFGYDLASTELVNADGSGARTVADFTTYATYTVAFGPIWSPDGTSLIVPALVQPGPDPRDTSAQLFAIEVASGLLTTPHAGRYVSYSHDGRYIAYQTQTSYGFNEVVGVCRPDGSGDVAFRKGSYAAWSPTAERVAYVTNPGYLTVSAPGGGKRWTLRTMKAGPEAWFPDGKTVVFTHVGRRPALFLVVPGAHKARKLVDIPANAAGSVSISPNGRWIAASSAELTFLVRSDGTGLTVLHATGAAWSPNAATLALVDGHALSVWTPAGGVQGVYAAPGLLSEPSWSPDGKRVVVVDSGN